MLPFAGFVGLVLFAFSIWAFIDLSLTKKEDVRIAWKPVWWIALILAGPAGSFAWTFFGRPKNAGFVPGGGSRTRTAPTDGSEAVEGEATEKAEKKPYPPAPRGPEDSPEWAAFIENASLNQSTDTLTTEIDPETAEDFSNWEAEFGDPDAGNSES